jgi:hypothetical protein
MAGSGLALFGRNDSIEFLVISLRLVTTPDTRFVDVRLTKSGLERLLAVGDNH